MRHALRVVLELFENQLGIEQNCGQSNGKRPVSVACAYAVLTLRRFHRAVRQFVALQFKTVHVAAVRAQRTTGAGFDTKRSFVNRLSSGNESTNQAQLTRTASLSSVAGKVPMTASLANGLPPRMPMVGS